MTKKVKNRKHIQQNKRNRIINRRYSSTIKTLLKFLNNKIEKILKNENTDSIYANKIESQQILNNFYSIIDKAVKKNVIHRNTAARKKSKALKIFRKV
jgi:small subunit ribosomal protein S20